MDAGISITSAVALCLFAASLWGSWAASLKYLGSYPLDGFVVTLYASSFVFVWVIAFIFDTRDLVPDILGMLGDDPVRIAGVIGGGAAFAIGMSLTLTVMRSIGLTIAQPIQSASSIILGTVWTTVIGGVPEGVPLSRIILAISVLIAAVMFTMLAAWFRSRGWQDEAEEMFSLSKADIVKILPVVLGAAILTSAYPWALALGLRSPTQPNGLDVFPYMALLVTGSFIGVMGLSGTRLVRAGAFRHAMSAPFHIKRWGIGSGIFHFGGNIIHSIGAASLSASIAFPLGLSASFWTQLWGLNQGEFAGASRVSQVSLAIGMTMYCLGIALIVTTL